MPPTNPADDSAGMPDWMGADDTPEGLDLSGMLLPAEPPPTIPTPAPAPAPPPPTPPTTRPARRPATHGEPFLYGAVVSFGSKVASNEVQVEHDIPPGVRVLATSPIATSSSGRTLTWKFGRAEVGTKIPIRIKAVAINGVDWADHGQATFRTSYVTRSSFGVPVIRPAVSLEMAGPAGVELGAATEFTLKVRNTGTCPVRDIRVQLSATGGLSLLSDTAIAFAAIPTAGAVTATVRVAGRTAGEGAVLADVVAVPHAVGAAQATCAVTVAKLDLSFAESEHWKVNREQPLRVVVRNSGTAAARMVGLRVTIPTGWKLTPEPTGYDAASRVVFTQVDRLEPQAELALPLTVQPSLPGTGVFRAVAEDMTGECVAELHAKAELDAAESHSILERFVQEVGYAPSAVATDTGSTAKAASPIGREHPHVIFAVADTEYAFPLSSVREIGRPPASTPLPGSPDWLVGVANIRGGILSMVDMRAFFDEKPGAASHDRRLLVVTAPGGDLSAGLLVDRVRGIQSIPPEQVRVPAAPITARCSAYMAGVAGLDRRQVVVLVPDRLLLAPEFLPFGSA
ncbi:MAG: hypothetical protein C0467_24160 [Planctomycetaceae bacterium]|nr:hypothetical protein [Planctomycetaceae bacterium]